MRRGKVHEKEKEVQEGRVQEGRIQYMGIIQTGMMEMNGWVAICLAKLKVFVMIAFVLSRGGECEE